MQYTTQGFFSSVDLITGICLGLISNDIYLRVYKKYEDKLKNNWILSLACIMIYTTLLSILALYARQNMGYTKQDMFFGFGIFFFQYTLIKHIHLEFDRIKTMLT